MPTYHSGKYQHGLISSPKHLLSPYLLSHHVLLSSPFSCNSSRCWCVLQLPPPKFVLQDFSLSKNQQVHAGNLGGAHPRCLLHFGRRRCLSRARAFPGAAPNPWSVPQYGVPRPSTSRTGLERDQTVFFFFKNRFSPLLSIL